MSEQKIIQGDCLEVMKTFADKQFDLVLTDPPYGVGKDFANDDLSDKDLEAFLQEISKELKRITKYHLLLDAPKNKIDLFCRAFSDWNFEYTIVLHETNGMRNGKVGYNNCGILLWFSNEKRKVNRYKDVWSESITNTKKDFSHPSPKNPKHYKRALEMFSGGRKEGEKGETGDRQMTILDPFMGSGTTLLVAKQLGLNATGIEISPEYCQIAQDRLSACPTPLF